MVSFLRLALTEPLQESLSDLRPRVESRFVEMKCLELSYQNDHKSSSFANTLPKYYVQTRSTVTS